MAEVTLTVCTTCRKIAGELPVGDGACPGERMLEALQAADLPDNLRLRPIACFSACTRGCTIALSGGPSHWTYLYGDLDPDNDIDAIAEGARAYAASDDGIVAWRERPLIFRKQSIARFPPQEQTS